MSMYQKNEQEIYAQGAIDALNLHPKDGEIELEYGRRPAKSGKKFTRMALVFIDRDFDSKNFGKKVILCEGEAMTYDVNEMFIFGCVTGFILSQKSEILKRKKAKGPWKKWDGPPPAGSDAFARCLTGI